MPPKKSGAPVRLKIEYLTPEELRPYENNAKEHPDAQVNEIANSIREFDFSDPIGIWGNNQIVEGHGRLLAALKMGLKEVPVIRLDHLTDEQRKAYALAHNQTTMTSGWNADKLLEELSQQSIDMSQFGFDMSILEEDSEVFEDDYKAAAAPTIAKSGQLWVLGNHRLMCGDSANKDDLQKLMGGGRS